MLKILFLMHYYFTEDIKDDMFHINFIVIVVNKINKENKVL